MRKAGVLILGLLLIAGCTHKAVISSSDEKINVKSNGRYEYMLTEALRQKYFGEISDAAILFEKCIDIDSKRAVPYFELAQLYSNAGMQDKSLLYATKAARIEPENYWYQLACGSLFTQYQKKDSALVYFTRALKADKRAVEVNSILAGIYSEKGETEKADSLFRIIGSEGELNDDMFLMMISGLIMNDELDEAAKRTRVLIEEKPEEIRYKALLADIYSENNEPERSDSIYKEIIENNPDNIESQLLYLMNLVYKKQYSGITVFLNNVFESEVVDRDRKIAVASRIISDTAYVKENSASLAESLVLLENRYSDDEEILSLRPEMLEIAGENDQAIERYEEIIKKVKAGNYFKEKLILLYADKKEYKKLYELTSEYSRENNLSILGKVYYAISAMELKEYEVADNELKKAMILAGNNDEFKVQILSMIGDLKYRMKDYKSSYEFYEEALKIAPEDPLILNNYAYFLAEGNSDLKKALRMSEKVMEKEGNNDTYIDTYAWVLFKLGRYRDAHKAMIKIFEKDEERDAEILEHMGYITRELKRCSEAVIYWENALKIDSSKTYLKQEIKRCGKE
ncbi:MAG: hypothetical protein RBT02_00095 [Bacteroidales bacterium]|jgi:tetratricopeptide (TPR) repeat protein|nr:hypothetical protein [Bacteroidales bacterium]